MFNYDYEKLKAEGVHSNNWYVDYEQDPIYPLNIGLSLHECVGTVTESTSEKFKVGDFVLGIPVAQYGFFEYLTLPEERIYPMPSAPVSKQEILMSQPLGTILYGFRKLPGFSGKTVAVIGQGPIGLMMNPVLASRGADQIIAIDKLGYRAEVSKEMGSTAQIDSSKQDPVHVIESLTEGEMADIVIEAAGHHELSINLAADLVGQDGHVLQFGVTDLPFVENYPAGILYAKNVSVHNSVGAYHEKDFIEAARLIAKGEIDVKPLLTHTFKLEEVQTAFEHYVDRKDEALKVLLDFS